MFNRSTNVELAGNEEGIKAENKKGMITHNCRYEAPQFELAQLLIRRDKAPFLFFAFNLMLCGRCFLSIFFSLCPQFSITN